MKSSTGEVQQRTVESKTMRPLKRQRHPVSLDLFTRFPHKIEGPHTSWWLICGRMSAASASPGSANNPTFTLDHYRLRHLGCVFGCVCGVDAEAFWTLDGKGCAPGFDGVALPLVACAMDGVLLGIIGEVDDAGVPAKGLGSRVDDFGQKFVNPLSVDILLRDKGDEENVEEIGLKLRCRERDHVLELAAMEIMKKKWSISKYELKASQ